MKTIFLTVVVFIVMSAFLPKSILFPDDDVKDPRDGTVYKTLKIGTQVWMAENLRYNVPGSKCYQDNPGNCDAYGRLYDWGAAKNACPQGWHLPSKEEWEKLILNYPDNETAYKSLITGGHTGFNATLHGIYGLSGNQFVMLEEHGAYWSSTEFNADRAWAQRFLRNTGDTYPSQAIKVNGQACRCVKN